MKKIFSLLVLSLAAALHLGAQEIDHLNCFAVLAGKNATKDGSVMLAHNEDDSGEQMINIYNVPRNPANGTGKYLWIEFPGMEVADAFMNEYGVAVASDGCNSKEDREDYTDGGVLYEVRTLIGQKARSARHAVKIAGELVEQKGYRGSGRTYVIADCNEGWVFAVVRGRHWVAQRIPDDCVMTIPNYYCIGEIDLSDTANFQGTPDIIDYAIERGWYNPEKDGKFLFKKVYSRPDMYSYDRNYVRHMSALNHLTGETYSTDPDTYPFAVKPDRLLEVKDMMQ
ncbi:MAG: C69 family dipeptidase, partial [Bacteroidales bacterium]|nr:C69 family dipeptidase [Bacteroidales bacterium]